MRSSENPWLAVAACRHRLQPLSSRADGARCPERARVNQLQTITRAFGLTCMVYGLPHAPRCPHFAGYPGHAPPFCRADSGGNRLSCTFCQWREKQGGAIGHASANDRACKGQLCQERRPSARARGRRSENRPGDPARHWFGCRSFRTERACGNRWRRQSGSDCGASTSLCCSACWCGSGTCAIRA